jgi:very-short-patch-repair endonuclease
MRGKIGDAERSKYFESLGYKVIRFWNNQVENDTHASLAGIVRAVEVAIKN